MIRQSIETDDLKRLLENVEERLGADTDSDLVRFGAFLAQRLASTVNPQSLVVACEIAFFDLQEGYDQLREAHVNSALDGITQEQVSRLRDHMVLLVDDVTPSRFAEAFAGLYADFLRRLQQVSATGAPNPELN